MNGDAIVLCAWGLMMVVILVAMCRRSEVGTKRMDGVDRMVEAR